MGGRGNPRRGEGKSRIVKLNHIIEESAFHGEMRWLTCGFVAVWLRWLTCGDVSVYHFSPGRCRVSLLKKSAIVGIC